MYRSKFFMTAVSLFCFSLIISLSSISNYCFSNDIYSRPIPYDTLPSGKKVLQWKEIAPYVYMDKICQNEKIMLVYSDMQNLILQTDKGMVTPSEILVVHEMIRKSNDPNYQETNAKIVMRYAFCVEDIVKEVTIKNDKAESLPIVLANAFISRNVGIVVNEDKEYINLIAKAIEQAETQRSLVLESLKVLAPDDYESMMTAATTKKEENAIAANTTKTEEKKENYYGQNYYHSQPENKEKDTPVAKGNSAVKEVPAVEKKSEYKENLAQNNTTEKATVAKEVPVETPRATTTPKTMPIKEEKVVPVKKSYPAIFESYARENFIATTTKDVAIDYEKVALGKNGNGYKIQIIAKLLDDHNQKSIQKYYELPYTVEEHYDGKWHRYTLSGYSNSWDKTYALLQEIRKSYGIEDAFISLYQDNERLGIYPCNSVGFAEWVQKKSDNGFEPFSSREEYLAQNGKNPSSGKEVSSPVNIFPFSVLSMLSQMTK